jgi:uncharacterized membrane protein
VVNATRLFKVIVMKIGIYISGLGQSFSVETVDKYAGHLMNEMSYSTQGVAYELKSEKVSYTRDRTTEVVSICETGEEAKVVYKIYEFKYHDLLTEKFNRRSILSKNWWLFLLVVRKLPLILKRTYKKTPHNRPFQTLYLFFIFMTIAAAVLFMLPATIGHIVNTSVGTEALKTLRLTDIPFITKALLENFSEFLVSLIALTVLFLPDANVFIVNLATEFVCANDYLEQGGQKQMIQGNLEKLIDFISENETDCKIHIHSYSYGSILALDYIYPYGNKVTNNARKYCEAIITIGTPFEFIKSYYQNFYKDRYTEFGDLLCWINVYSVGDALGTNFRNDGKIGTAEFGLTDSSNKPINVSYEITAQRRMGIVDFFTLHSVRVHGMYWDEKEEGQSCLGLVYETMKQKALIT